jgi:UDP-N-acetylmuramate dehydrogenase
MKKTSFKLIENANLAPICSMKAGGNAKFLAEPKSETELLDALRFFKERGIKYIVVGKCSNLLFPDGTFEGAVILTEGIKGLSISEGIISAFCGETLSALATFACENSVSGFEFSHGIPGCIGGGVFMNAGAYGGEISQIFVSGRFINKNLEIITLSAEEMNFGYRKSVMADNELILVSASFTGENGSKEEILQKMNELMAKRRASQPLQYPSCGSAFKRPEGHFAGALIEQCGLKGKSIGGAQVSEKHAGFVINKGNATATDVIDLLNYVSETVFEQTGVRLEPEIRIIY